MIWNLIDNAVKYSPDRPAVSVRIGRADGRVSISVRDEGVGVVRAEQTQATASASASAPASVFRSIPSPKFRLTTT